MEVSNAQYIEGIAVSIAGLFLLLIYSLYLKRHWTIMYVLEYFYKSSPAELKKDTRTQDWLLLILMLAFIIVMGVKLVTFMVVVSDSMTPEFKRGDMILTQSFSLKPEVGDIITFNVTNRRVSVSHRVVEITEAGRIITKGDNNPFKDDFRTEQDNIIAKVIQINGHPIVIKNIGALFITDYSKQGVIYKFGDRFTFLQQLSATVRAWGFIITAIALLSYLLLMKGDR
jgi:signal peptidase